MAEEKIEQSEEKAKHDKKINQLTLAEVEKKLEEIKGSMGGLYLPVCPGASSPERNSPIPLGPSFPPLSLLKPKFADRITPRVLSWFTPGAPSR